MASVLTINKVISFPDKIENTVIGKEEVIIEGKSDVAETSFSKGSDNSKNIEGYNRYIIKHSQKFKIEGKLWDKSFKSILRIMKATVYESKNNRDFLFSIGNLKADYIQSAFARLRSKTSIKSEPLEVDLIEAVEKIILYAPDIKIISGWFSELNLPNLKNVMLQGDKVNLGPEWDRFKTTKGAKLSNIELLIDDADFENGVVTVSLSKRGVIFSRRNISHKKLLQISNKIIGILNKELKTKKLKVKNK
ncbi:hypothetical protein MKZ20_08140 [Psychrobacillus sp. FSL K6-2684]|uniref:hypothetical protein n=1 Tax=Psychrobacillus sp. FSL K6-2684 TaxID=2921547 RepID=UPI0030F7C9CA